VPLLQNFSEKQKVIVVLDGNEDIRLVGIKFFDNSQMDAFVTDMQNRLNEGEPLETTSLL